MTSRPSPAIAVRPYTSAEDDRLVEWLVSDEWPYHGNPRPGRDLVRGWVREGLFSGEEARTFCIAEKEDRDGAVGLIRLFELGDATPMFDLRIRSTHRGRGLGTAAVRWVTAYVFADLVGKRRIEATTRADNAPMRAVLGKCGYAKEAHYRRAWGSSDGTFQDGVAYGILREDWAAGKVTPVAFEDGDPSAGAATVRSLWGAFERRDWAAARALLDERFRAVWPNTGETFDRDEFVRVNEAYPGHWTIRVERVLETGGGGGGGHDGEVVSVVEVVNGGQRVFATSFFAFDAASGKIHGLTEYWGDCGPPPDWRPRLLGRS